MQPARGEPVEDPLARRARRTRASPGRRRRRPTRSRESTSELGTASRRATLPSASHANGAGGSPASATARSSSRRHERVGDDRDDRRRRARAPRARRAALRPSATGRATTTASSRGVRRAPRSPCAGGTACGARRRRGRRRRRRRAARRSSTARGSGARRGRASRRARRRRGGRSVTVYAGALIARRHRRVDGQACRDHPRAQVAVGEDAEAPVGEVDDGAGLAASSVIRCGRRRGSACPASQRTGGRAQQPADRPLERRLGLGARDARRRPREDRARDVAQALGPGEQRPADVAGQAVARGRAVGPRRESGGQLREHRGEAEQLARARAGRAPGRGRRARPRPRARSRRSSAARCPGRRSSRRRRMRRRAPPPPAVRAPARAGRRTGPSDRRNAATSSIARASPGRESSSGLRERGVDLGAVLGRRLGGLVALDGEVVDRRPRSRRRR